MSPTEQHDMVDSFFSSAVLFTDKQRVVILVDRRSSFIDSYGNGFIAVIASKLFATKYKVTFLSTRVSLV